MPCDQFFAAIIAAGAILSGFCGTFLAFRIQREANYYRQPALDFRTRKARDIYVGLTHFTSALLLLISATICSMVFGFLIPLLALAGSPWASARTKLVVGGLVAALILLFAYFLDELIHYRIISSRLLNDAREWRTEWAVVLVAGILVAVSFAVVYKVL